MAKAMNEVSDALWVLPAIQEVVLQETEADSGRLEQAAS